MSGRPGPVLVTGANSGIGLASALRFASRGWETWGTVRSSGKADVLAEAANAAGVADLVRPVVLDVSDHDAVVERWPEMPGFYAVVNNAGYSELGAVEEVSADEVRRQLDVNLIAPARLPLIFPFSLFPILIKPTHRFFLTSYHRRFPSLKLITPSSTIELTLYDAP